VGVLAVEQIIKSFAAGVRVLDDVTLEVADGEIASLLGPSGCGKTTLLRIVAGLELPDAGTVRYDGEEITRRAVHLRHFGFMFQDYALFPHMNVGANVAFGLRMAGWDKAQQRRRVDEMLEIVNLRGYAQRSVDELSGGEQQRVALARTLAPSPRLLLLDEPLANLDRLLREELVDELRTIISRVGVTTIFVTHDQAEAFALANHVVVMRQGRIEQEGTPQAVHRHPANTFVAGFLGFHNLLAGRVDASGRTVATSVGVLQLDKPPDLGLLAGPYCVLIRPDAARLLPAAHASLVASADPEPAPEPVPAGVSGSANVLVGRVVNGSFRGGSYRIILAPDSPGAPLLQFDLPTHGVSRLPGPGDFVRLELAPGGVLLVAGDIDHDEQRHPVGNRGKAVAPR
jgi:ABC-type Fe3+/spermidine/putrescine transport system ATPase subunit